MLRRRRTAVPSSRRAAWLQQGAPCGTGEHHLDHRRVRLAHPVARADAKDAAGVEYLGLRGEPGNRTPASGCPRLNRPRVLAPHRRPGSSGPRAARVRRTTPTASRQADAPITWPTGSIPSPAATAAPAALRTTRSCRRRSARRAAAQPTGECRPPAASAPAARSCLPRSMQANATRAPTGAFRMNASRLLFSYLVAMRSGQLQP